MKIARHFPFAISNFKTDRDAQSGFAEQAPVVLIRK